MSLWGPKSVAAMSKYSPMSILPAFIQALECCHHIVTYEIANQVCR